MTTSSRRTFLKGLSTAAAIGVIARVPPRRLWAAVPGELVPEADEALLRSLARTAVDAARAAGATFADARVFAGQSIALSCGIEYAKSSTPAMELPDITVETTYGIRAIVDGGVGFAGGTELTPDAVRAVARHAVARARGNRPLQPRAQVLAPVPYADQGTWTAPIAEDPFAVPVGEQMELAFAAIAEAGRVKGIDAAAISFRWNRNVRVFASSDGALVVQRMAIAAPYANAATYPKVETFLSIVGAREGVPALRRGPYGYEVLSRIDLKDELRQAAERAVIAARRPPSRSVEVGRYDLVFSGPVMAALLIGTIAEALNLERALGYRANDPFSGTSFAAPPKEILGRYQVASPLVTVRADRTRPEGGATVRWDDEGVRPGEHTLVRDGVIVDYLTNRRTAIELAPWYESRGEVVGSRGCASSGGRRLPRVGLPNLTMEPGRDDVAIDDLIAGTKRGLYIDGIPFGSSDQQVLNQQFMLGDGGAREIRDGKLGGWVRDVAFQFNTPVLWRAVDAIGGARSAVDTIQYSGYSETRPIYLPYATVSAVPARVPGVNVMNVGSMA